MKKITILMLYPNEMNIYGDGGNILVLKQRLAWRGFEAEIKYHEISKPLNNGVDIIVGGGGQDSGQQKIFKDLLKNGPKLRQLADQGVPMLMVCGLYQLFGHRFITSDNSEIPGIGIFDAETTASHKRLIGNIVINTKFGKVVGYENHSGQTKLLREQAELGEVLKGYGNDLKSKKEGAVYRNVYGTYLHGPILPKNPILADHLIKLALTNKYSLDNIAELDDRLTLLTRKIAITR